MVSELVEFKGHLNLFTHQAQRVLEFEDFTIWSWNIKCALSHEGRRHAKDLVRKHHPLFIFLMETHRPFLETSLFWSCLGYDICALSEAFSRSNVFGC
ncbi:hypothetical protein MTR_5g010670 [Medicago truncatula]|uniref:Endonuclease/exonuclease/phosphatase family protein n=1 Tax=Medicago truncatula TaxID=3880 RepID=G7KDF6_MEDTR|nr:hypothetical protein MTR_5g010670 [Medicago truncatula]